MKKCIAMLLATSAMMSFAGEIYKAENPPKNWTFRTKNAEEFPINYHDDKADIYKKLDILDKIGKDHVIPEDKILGFSAGIAECKESRGVLKALSNADKALYKIKKGTKNDYAIWSK